MEWPEQNDRQSDVWLQETARPNRRLLNAESSVARLPASPLSRMPPIGSDSSESGVLRRICDNRQAVSRL
jgi:hypothetical protein